LTDKELLSVFENAFDEPVDFGHKPTEEEILLICLRAVEKAVKGER